MIECIQKHLNFAETSLDPSPAKHICRQSVLFSDSVIKSTIGNGDRLTTTNEPHTLLKSTYFETIDAVLTEMKRRFEKKTLLLAVAAFDPQSNHFFCMEQMQPLTSLNLVVPSAEELFISKSTIDRLLKDEKIKDSAAVLKILFDYKKRVS